MYKKIHILICCLIIINTSKAQLYVSGIIYDSSFKYGVENVKVINSAGNYAYSDSLGNYKINVTDTDTIHFYFRNKPTQKFAVAKIPDLTRFNVKLHISYLGKYRLMKEVTVFSSSFKQKAEENRETYAKVFAYEKPGLQSNVSNGVAGADLNSLINMFRFRHNKTMRWFQKRLEAEEQEKFIDYRFSKYKVRRITQLEGALLDSFMLAYRPTYEFTSLADELAFNQYIINCFYEYKLEMLKPKN